MRHAAIRVGLFTPSLAFDRVVVKYIEALKHPSTMLVELVVEELQRTLREQLEKVPSLQWFLFELLPACLSE